jgi:thiamine transporter
MSRSRLLPLVEAAVMIALAAVLSQITVFKMPQGGSITAASMVPLLLVGLRHGPRWGILAGVAAGLVNYITATEPYVHPVQLLLDYPVAFGVLGLAGLGAGKSYVAGGVAAALGMFGRFAAHVISGVVFFAQYAPAGQSVWAYSAVYNASYMVPELIISGLLLAGLLPLLQLVVPVRHDQHTAAQ